MHLIEPQKNQQTKTIVCLRPNKCDCTWEQTCILASHRTNDWPEKKVAFFCSYSYNLVVSALLTNIGKSFSLTASTSMWWPCFAVLSKNYLVLNQYSFVGIELRHRWVPAWLTKLSNVPRAWVQNPAMGELKLSTA